VTKLFAALALLVVLGCADATTPESPRTPGVVVDGVDLPEVARQYRTVRLGQDEPQAFNQWDDPCTTFFPAIDWDSVVVKGLQSGFPRDTAFLIGGWTSAPVRGYVFRDGGRRDCSALVSWAKAKAPGGGTNYTWGITVTGAQTVTVTNGNGVDALLIGQAFHPSQGKGMDTIYVAD
jgi:hypothetical protein